MRRFGLFIALLLTAIVTVSLLGAAVPSSSTQAVQAEAVQMSQPSPAGSPVASSLAEAVAPSQPEVVAASPATVGPNETQGKLTFLRVHDVGTGYGPPSDFLDVEVVVQLNHDNTRSYGFQLRDDANRPARQGMLDLLRDAFNHNWTVIIDYMRVDATKNNGTIIRVALIK